jgi:hypothetical protein
MRLTSLCLAATLTTATAVTAAPLDKTIVPADADWVAHIDMEAAMASSIYRIMRDQPDFRADVDEAVAEVKAMFGVDPLKELKDITVFGMGSEEDDIVAVMSTTDALDGVVAQLEGMIASEGGELKTIDADGKTIITLEDGDEVNYACIIRGAMPGTRSVYFAPDLDRLLAGMKVKEEKAPSLMGSDNPLASETPGGGAIFWAAVGDISSLPDADEAAMFTQYARQISIEVGESMNQAYVAATTRTATLEDADNVMAVMNGLLAMGKIAATQDPEMKELVGLLDGLRMEQQGTKVSLRIAMTFNEIERFIRLHATEVEHEHDHAH